MESTMTAAASGDSTANSALIEKAKLFRDHIQSIITLATGALALSVTFLHDIAAKHAELWLIKRAWAGLVLSVALGIISNYVLLLYTKKNGDKYQISLAATVILLHVGFLSSLVYLVRFGQANL
jgi:hypothetical protein